MNRRQQKKKIKQQELTIILRSDDIHRTAVYEKIKGTIEKQFKAGSVIVLPAYLHVEAIIQQRGSRRIEIKPESEVKQNEV